MLVKMPIWTIFAVAVHLMAIETYGAGVLFEKIFVNKRKGVYTYIRVYEIGAQDNIPTS